MKIGCVGVDFTALCIHLMAVHQYCLGTKVEKFLHIFHSTLLGSEGPGSFLKCIFLCGNHQYTLRIILIVESEECAYDMN